MAFLLYLSLLFLCLFVSRVLKKSEVLGLQRGKETKYTQPTARSGAHGWVGKWVLRTTTCTKKQRREGGRSSPTAKKTEWRLRI